MMLLQVMILRSRFLDARRKRRNFRWMIHRYINRNMIYRKKRKIITVAISAKSLQKFSTNTSTLIYRTRIQGSHLWRWISSFCNSLHLTLTVRSLLWRWMSFYNSLHLTVRRQRRSWGGNVASLCPRLFCGFSSSLHLITMPTPLTMHIVFNSPMRLCPLHASQSEG